MHRFFFSELVFKTIKFKIIQSLIPVFVYTYPSPLIDNPVAFPKDFKLCFNNLSDLGLNII